MSVVVEAELLRYELAIRGMSAIDLARKTRLSPATVSAALTGKPIAEVSLRLIVDALASVPVDEVIVRLLGPRSECRAMISNPSPLPERE
jgi:transcriptional regulator with XRE-family HTH domain